MAAAFDTIDDLLRGRGTFDKDGAGRSWWVVPLIILATGPIYGLAMGSYRVVDLDRWLMMIYVAIKVPLLFGATTLLCLPAFAVLSTILGLRDDLRESIQAILCGQAGIVVVLAALAPLTRVWYSSTDNYRSALLFNAAMFTVATLAGHVVMRRHYRVLVRRRRNHRITMCAWLVLYVFVGIQMGWLLRPFIGDPDDPVAFFRPNPFSNAYVVIVRLILG